MAIKDAEKFIKDVAVDKELRMSLYNFANEIERKNYLKEAGYNFSMAEFNESINHLKTESPTREQAEMIDELYLWWHMLNNNEDTSCSPSQCKSCSGC